MTWFSVLQVCLALSVSVVQAAPTCNDLTLTVSARADNIELPLDLNLTALTPESYQALTSLNTTSLSGTYSIAARYCEPEVDNAARRNTLQLLVHGVTLTKDYWFGLPTVPGSSIQYSWVDYASQQGYPTLAFDRICNGDSSKPNGLLVCQVPYNTEVLYQIIQQVRNDAVVGGRNFNTVIPVCHSEGSVVCQFNMQVHPDTPVGTYILSGFTNRLLVGAPGSYVAGVFVPASLDVAYQIGTNARGLEGIFFAGDYDRAFAGAATSLQYTRPLTLGELGTALLSQFPAPEYTGSLLVLNGQQDQIFCARSPLDPIVGFLGDCGSGSTSTSAQTAVLFPNAMYNWTQIAETGHNLNLHLTAQEVFKAAHDYLDANGF